MFPGFLSRATLMFDVVSLAMFLVLPVLTWSIYEAKYRHNYALHKRLQVGLGLVLLVAVLLFEVDIRTHDWKPLTEASPYHDTTLWPMLWVHLFFSISTTLLWIVTIVLALRKFPNPPTPGPHSRIHVPLARTAALFMFCTALTGWTFYWMAFVASKSS